MTNPHPTQTLSEFRESCKDLIESIGKKWQIKDYILQGNLWWINFGEDCYNKGKENNKQSIQEFLKQLKAFPENNCEITPELIDILAKAKFGDKLLEENKYATHKNCEQEFMEHMGVNKKDEDGWYSKEQKGCGAKMDAIGYIHCGDYDDLKHGGKQWLCDKCKENKGANQ